MPQPPLTTFITEQHKTHLIFDFDATLVFMNIPWDEWTRSLRDDILQLDAELWRAYETVYWGGPVQNVLVEKYGDRGLEILLRRQPLFEMQYSTKFTKNEQLMKEIDGFKSRYHLYIWSSNSHQLVDSVLQQTGMSDWFETVITRDEVRFVKPAPEGFELLRDAAVPKNRYLLIGDSSHDRDAAKSAGIDFYLADFFKLGR